MLICDPDLHPARAELVLCCVIAERMGIDASESLDALKRLDLTRNEVNQLIQNLKCQLRRFSGEIG